MLIDTLIVCEALLVFHGGLAVVFWMLYYMFTGKSLGPMGEAEFALAFAATMLGLMFVVGELKFDTLWIDATLFQLSFSTTYVMGSAFLRVLQLKR